MNLLKRISVESIGIPILAFFLILMSSSVYFRIVGPAFKMMILICVGLAFILFLSSMFFLLKSKTMLDKLILVYGYYFILSGLFVFLKLTSNGILKQDIIRVFIYPMLLIPVIYKQVITKNSLFIDSYINILIFLSVISVFFWSLNIFGVKPNMFKIVNWGSVHNVYGYFGIHFMAQGPVKFLGLYLPRNTGIFAESPMYSYVLSIALIAYLFLKSKTNILDWKSILLMFTIFTTTSTTGIMIILLSLTIKAGSKIKKRSLILVIPLGVTLFAGMIIILKSKMSSMSGSVNVRINDFYAGFATWKNAPILGNGLSNGRVLLSNMSMERTLYIDGNVGYSSGLLDMLMKGGIYFALEWLIIPIILFSRVNKNYFFFAAQFLILVIVTIINNTYLYATISIYMVVVGIFKFNTKQKIHEYY